MAPLKLRSHPALVIVDMQNGFCHNEGTFGKRGLPLSDIQAVIPQINHLRSLCHTLDIPVIFTRLGYKEDNSDRPQVANSLKGSRELHGFTRGTWDVDIVEELTPTSGEIVIDKNRNSAFLRTKLAETLDSMGVNHLIITGVGSNVCVECTARDSFQLDYGTVTVSDATATLTREMHQGTLTNLEFFGGTATVEEVEKALKNMIYPESADL